MHGRQSWPRLADRQSVVSLPGYFGVQSDAFADFPSRPAAAQLPPQSDAAAAVSWLHAIAPADDAAPALGLESLAGSRGTTMDAQPLHHASTSAETAELGRERSSYPADREFNLAMCGTPRATDWACTHTYRRWVLSTDGHMCAPRRPAEQAESFAFMRSLCGELEDGLGDVLPAGLCGLAAFADF
jgi:hypothetical protein